MDDRAGRAAAVCFLLVSMLAVGVRAGSAWRGAEGTEVLIFDCDFESGACGVWSAVASQDECNGLDDDCDTDVDEDASCSGALACCGSAGCVDLMSNPDHCLFCDTDCPFVDNGTPSCTAGQCGIGSCNQGFDDCDEQVFNGCETNLNSDIDHCNACDQPCSAVEHGVPSCTNGACGIGSCDEGFDDCDGKPFNGCEVDLGTDVDHCGDCETVCASEETCTGGICIGT